MSRNVISIYIIKTILNTEDKINLNLIILLYEIKISNYIKNDINTNNITKK